MNKHNSDEKSLNVNDFNTIYVHKAIEDDKIANLINLLTSETNRDIKEEVWKMLKQEENGLNILIEAIANSNEKNLKSVLVATCWEAGIDCSKYLSVFIDLALNEDYYCSLEAITVIENMEGPFEEAELLEYKENINQALNNSDSDKTNLFKSLIDILSDFQLNNCILKVVIPK